MLISLQFQNHRVKLADITISIISAVGSRCQCSLTVNHITNEHFLCTSDQQVVLYRAKLSGHSDCARVLSYIQQWVNGGQRSILVQGNITEVYPSCSVEINSLVAQADCARPTTVGPATESVEITTVGGAVQSITVGGVGGVGQAVGGVVGGAVGGMVLIGIIVLAAVVCVCTCKNKHK